MFSRQLVRLFLALAIIMVLSFSADAQGVKGGKKGKAIASSGPPTDEEIANSRTTSHSHKKVKKVKAEAATETGVAKKGGETKQDGAQ